MKTISGWHHITNIASDAQKNYEFYTEVLGMRLLKKTVNQDDISHTIHSLEMKKHHRE
ncbi:VOC family protein [Erysipelothrix sp. D19-032]